MPLGRGKIIVRNGLSQPEASGGDQDSGSYGIGSPLHLNNADKVLSTPNEEQVDAPLPGLSLRAQLGKAAGGI
jgi:hypothetical protein